MVLFRKKTLINYTLNDSILQCHALHFHALFTFYCLNSFVHKCSSVRNHFVHEFIKSRNLVSDCFDLKTKSKLELLEGGMGGGVEVTQIPGSAVNF